MILPAIIGGIGTLFGPVIGAFLLTGLSELMQDALAAFGLDLPGAKQVLYGICLLLVVVVLPEGVWPGSQLGSEQRGYIHDGAA
jgi:branched-chain amino acid transport system permease protein